MISFMLVFGVFFCMIQAACSQTGSKLPVKIATRLAIFSATRRDKRLQRDHVVNSFADHGQALF
jgi:hypothetical protein